MNPAGGEASYPVGGQPLGTALTTGQPAVAGRASAAADPAAAGDEFLLRRVAAADERALAELYDRWVVTVHALVARIVSDPEDAEDVVEDVFWQAWRQAARYEGARGSVGTWLMTIARSRALDRLRARRRRREELLEEWVIDDRPGAGTDLAANVEASERRARVLAALDALPPEQRQVLEMAYFEGMSQTEIADRTDQPLGTIKTRVRLAMQKLRERLTTLREESRGS
jgi:RNA polymerase sigma-70 factor (ECF subfamily)